MLKKIILFFAAGSFVLFLAFIFCSVWNIDYVVIDTSDEALGINEAVNKKIVLANEIYDSNRKYEKPKEIKEIIKLEEEISPDIEQITEKENKEVLNIALFGIDSRQNNNIGRSDSIMIATIDFQNNNLKLSSLMRDMGVEIEGNGDSKLNHAYAYGGPQLAIKTINQNFGTNIRHYVTVNFFTLEKVIDAIGGVKIDVKESEIDMLNGLIEETASIEGVKPIHLKEPGEQTLNGKQAVAYARIRYVGNGDFERTDRQRRVLSSMIETAKEKVDSLPVITKLITEVLPLVETNLEPKEILSLGMEYLKSPGLVLKQQRFPMDGYWWHDNTGNMYFLNFEKEITRKQILDYVFKDIEPEQKK